MMKMTGYAFVVLVAALGLLQLIPVDRTNPPVEQDLAASPAIKSILKRACYDCHSNETVWPWYSRVAPISWLVAWDVREGREELNFSTWNRYKPKQRAKKIKETWEEVEEGEMPPWFYLPLHPEARVSDRDRQVLRDWAAAQPSTDHEEDDDD